jgi:hypothetical protein
MSKQDLESMGSTSGPASTQKPNVAGILDMVSGIGLCRTQDAWMLALIIPGLLALIGGIYARQRIKWVLAILGSICAIPVFLGVISTILVVTSRGEFKKIKK